MISIIIPVYNKENYLPDFLTQCDTLNDAFYEIVFINDGSTDNSNSILESYVINKKNAFLYSQSNRGVSAARNFGLNLVKKTSKYVMFFDADDEFDSKLLNDLYFNIVESDFDILTFSSVVISCVNRRNLCIRPVGEFSLTSEFENMYRSGMFQPCWNKIYKVKIIKERKISFNESISMGEDFRFNIEFFKASETYFNIPELIYFYHLGNEGALTSKYNEKSFEYFKDGIEMVSSLITDKGITYQGLSNRFIYALSDRCRNLLRLDASLLKKIKLFRISFSDVRGLLDEMDSSKFSFKERFLFFMLKHDFYKIYFFSVYLMSRKVFHGK